ncbi:lysozyme inhibitor LprI family protein, partial [Ralstonia pseudosolanacearum]
MRARACVAAALAVLAAPIALAGTLEACRTAPPEAGGA